MQTELATLSPCDYLEAEGAVSDGGAHSPGGLLDAGLAGAGRWQFLLWNKSLIPSCGAKTWLTLYE